jgi:hypothetical protein
MAKQRISSADLSWEILQQMKETGDCPGGMNIAVVDDPTTGWRAVVGRRHRRFIRAECLKRLADVEKRLRKVYALERATFPGS